MYDGKRQKKSRFIASISGNYIFDLWNKGRSSARMLQGIVFCIVGGAFWKKKKRKNFDDGEVTRGTEIMNTDIKKDFIQVTGILVGTYDLSPADAKSVTAIDYLCVYEYEYEGKKYKYRMHQRDNFSPIPETLELCFTKDPSKAHKVRNTSTNETPKATSGIDIGVVVWGVCIATVIGVIYGVYRFIKTISEMTATGELEINIPIVLMLICIFVIVIKATIKQNKKVKNRDVMIENAMLNNRTVTAYLTKTRRRNWVMRHRRGDEYLAKRYKEFPYVGKYTYTYKGKKYKQSFEFKSTPPSSMRLFFNKNPKDVFYSTHS